VKSSALFLIAIPLVVFIAEMHPGHEFSALSAVFVLLVLSFATFLFSEVTR
jgi:hypothetical protein